jgi:hypothetical protein
METEIGKVVGANDQADYLVQIHGPGDVPEPPTPTDYAFGEFVAIPVSDRDRLVGVIYATQLLNPAYGAMGPRLSTEQELPVFSPDYLNETATIVRVAVVGTAHAEAAGIRYDQRTPALAAAVDAAASRLSPTEIVEFHRGDAGVRLAYVPRLLARPFPALPDLLCGILDRLVLAFPEDGQRLAVARQNLMWQAVIRP